MIVEKLVFVSYGSRICIQTNLHGLKQILLGYLPPKTEFSGGVAADDEFLLLEEGKDKDCLYALYHNERLLVRTKNLAIALSLLESEWHSVIALHATPFLFVHAGVVGWQGRAIVIPGRSMSGKTSLVVALLKAGADYYSDEYAVFDEFGYVNPYSKPLSVREQQGEFARRCDVSELGGRKGQNAIPVGLVIATQYDKHACWEPQTLTPGQAVLQLLDNTICARTRTQHAIQVFSRVAMESLAISGNRPSGNRVASLLLELCQSTVHRLGFKQPIPVLPSVH